jgi:nucleotide-binding universal stress UspA family protein
MSNHHRDATHAHVTLVATDYSDASNEALQQALDSALEREIAAIHVVHVMDTGHAVILAEMSEVPIVPEPQLVASATAKLRRYVRAQLEAHGGDHTRLHTLTSHIRFGEAAEEIAQFAAELSADLVVVGTHPRHGASRWLIGSVAEKVVRSAPCPVLVARRKDAAETHESAQPPLDGTLPLPFPTAQATR